jgi:hypothetical protein
MGPQSRSWDLFLRTRYLLLAPKFVVNRELWQVMGDPRSYPSRLKPHFNDRDP